MPKTELYYCVKCVALVLTTKVVCTKCNTPLIKVVNGKIMFEEANKADNLGQIPDDTEAEHLPKPVNPRKRRSRRKKPKKKRPKKPKKRRPKKPKKRST